MFTGLSLLTAIIPLTTYTLLILFRANVAGFQGVPADVSFDAIYSNPPIRIGKSALHELLLAWLPRLRPDGHAYLVVQKHLGSDSLARWLADQGWPTTRLGSRAGYRVLDVSRPADEAT